MKRAGASRLLISLLLIGLTPDSAVAAQSNRDLLLETRPRRVKPLPDQQSAPAESVAFDSPKVIVPPAPVVIKKEPSMISVPLSELSPSPKYEERAAATIGFKFGSLFGYRRDPFTKAGRFHSGVDLKAEWGDPVGASLAGTVQYAGWYYGYGNLVIVDHGGGITTYYAHLSSFELEVGDKVERGLVLGYAGSTGRATSPHLHYEVRVNGSPVDPIQPIALDPSSVYFKQSLP